MLYYHNMIYCNDIILYYMISYNWKLRRLRAAPCGGRRCERDGAPLAREFRDGLGTNGVFST